MDPVIPADILDALWVALALVGLGMMAYGGLGLLGVAIALKRARLFEPETHGDDGGRPTAFEMQQATIRPTAVEQQRHSRCKAPETGSGLLVEGKGN